MRGPTSQVSACGTLAVCQINGLPLKAAPALTHFCSVPPVCHSQTFPFTSSISVLKLLSSLIGICVFASPSICAFSIYGSCVCLRSRGKRGSEERAGPRSVHPLSRSLQKLLRPRRVSVPHVLPL